MPCTGVVTTTDVDEATKDVEVAVMAKNVSIYKNQASSLEKNAASGVKASL